jgi:hypothetical protein
MTPENNLDIRNSLTIDKDLVRRAEIVMSFAIIERRNYCEHFNILL